MTFTTHNVSQDNGLLLLAIDAIGAVTPLEEREFRLDLAFAAALAAASPNDRNAKLWRRVVDAIERAIGGEPSAPWHASAVEIWDLAVEAFEAKAGALR